MCGNKTCEATETAQSCPADCGPQTVCGNTVCESGEAQSCPADCPASLRMQNNSSYTIYELYAKRCSDTAWGPDQTGANYVLSGNAFTLTGIPPGCYHFRAVSGSHYWLTQEGVDLSANEIYPWTLVN